MRKYAIFASLTILGMALVGRAVSLAQKPQKTPILAIVNESVAQKNAEPAAETALPNVPIVDEPPRETLKVVGERPTNTAEVPPIAGPQRIELLEQALQLPPSIPAVLPESSEKPTALAPTPVDPGPPPPVAIIATKPDEPRVRMAPAGNDPMGEIETFLDRNRKEAEQSIEVLNQEAEALKSRLQKVEAALARWKEVSRALNGKASTERAEANADPGPGEKFTTRTSVSPTTAESFQPTPTSAPSPDLQPTVPPSQPVTEPKPPEAIPTSLPAALPSTNDPKVGVPDATQTSLPTPAETKPMLPEPPNLPVPSPQPTPGKPVDTSPDSFPALPETTKPPVPTSGPDLPNLPPPKEREVPAESSAA